MTPQGAKTFPKLVNQVNSSTIMNSKKGFTFWSKKMFRCGHWQWHVEVKIFQVLIALEKSELLKRFVELTPRSVYKMMNRKFSFKSI